MTPATHLRAPPAKRLLVVEDNAEVRRLMVMTLMSHFVVEQAASGSEALVKADRTSFDGFVLDIMLSGDMSGLELLRHLRAMPNLGQAKAVMVTALNRPADLETATSLGVVGYLVKPFSPLQLVDRLTELIK